MMELFIRIQNGEPFEHPISAENLRQAFPEVDTNNLPEWIAKFERVEHPRLGVYEIHEKTTYSWFNGVVKDVHHVRSMTAQEKLEKQNQVKKLWEQKGYASWIFDEDVCAFKSPVPYPNDGNRYVWDETTTSWNLYQETE